LLLLIAVGMLLFALYLVLPYVARYAFADAAPADISSRPAMLASFIRIVLASTIPGILARISLAILAVLVVIAIAARFSKQPRISARLRLTASYALFLVVAGGVLLVGIYLVLRYVPGYPFAPRDPSEFSPHVSSRSETLAALIRVSGILLAGLAVIGIGGGWILAGWILRPLQRINEAAQVAATGRLDHRIRLSGRNDEFRELADSFDHMLDRLHDAFTVQERFAANASHELRTPLTVNATLLDVARRNPDEQDYATLLERLAITNARAIGLTEALLRLADANSIMANSEPTDLSKIVRDALDECADEAEEDHVLIDTDLHPAPTIGDATLLRQLTTNLIQNAIRHNSPSGYAFVATVYDPPRSVVRLRVENSGRRYTPKQVELFTEPFLRGDGRVRRSDHEQGYGLGLALVARIVTVHGGTLKLFPRAEGGLTVTVSLPSQAHAWPREAEKSRRRAAGLAQKRHAAWDPASPVRGTSQRQV
jgi:two-component system sensor histidine kinase VanS